MKASPGKIAYRMLLAFLVAMLAWITLAVTQVVFERNQSSDSYYLLALYEDLFVHGYDISQWNFTPAPYFFPDALVLFSLLGWFYDYGHGMALYALVFWGVLLVASAELAVPFSSNRRNAYVMTLACIGLCIAAMRLYQNFGIPGFLFLPSFHAGCLWFGLLSCLWMRRWLYQAPSRREWSIHLALCFFMIVSDPLYIIQFALPLIAAALVLTLRHNATWKRFGWIAAAQVIAIILAQTFYAFNEWMDWLNIPRAYFKFETNIAAIGTIFRNIVVDQAQLLQASPLFLIVLSVVVILWILAAVYLWCREGTINQPANPNILYNGCIFFFSLLFTAAGLACTGIWQSLWGSRYFLNLYVFPFISLGWLLLFFSFHWMRWVRLAFVFLALGSSLWPLHDDMRALRWQNLRLPYPQWLQELDALAAQRGLRYGYGDYWSAKFITIGSRAGVRVNQLHEDMVHNQWINNNAWLLTPQGDFPRYRFILPQRLPHEKLLALFGEPAEVVYCGDREVWLYNRTADIAFRNFFKGQLARAERSRFVHAPRRPKNLAKYNRTGALYDENAAIMQLNEPVEAVFQPPATGEILEISADNNDAYRAEVFLPLQHEPHAAFTLHPTPLGGMVPRFFRLPSSLMRQPIDRVRLIPIQGDGRFGVGHVLVYDDE